jgi:hypothetical protein
MIDTATHPEPPLPPEAHQVQHYGFQWTYFACVELREKDNIGPMPTWSIITCQACGCQRAEPHGPVPKTLAAGRITYICRPVDP